MKAIFKRELYALLRSLRGWGYAAVVLLTAGVAVLLNNIIGGDVRFELNAQYIVLSMIPAAAIAAADVFQAERRQNTERLIYSLPVSNAGIVIGKMLALIVPVMIACAGLCVFPLIMLPFGQISLAGAYASILAMLFVGIVLMAIGMFMSAYANNLFMAILGTIALPLLSWAMPYAAEYLASVAAVNIALLIGLMLLTFAGVYLLSGSGVIAIFMAAAVEVPVLLHYLRGTGNEMMLWLANVVDKLNLFDSLVPYMNGLLDGRVLIGQAAVAVFFVFVSALLVVNRRQAKRRAL